MTYLKSTPSIMMFFLSLLLLSSSALGVIKLPSFIFYLCIAFFLFISLIKKNKHEISIQILLLILICLFSIIYNNPPHYFKSYQRYGAFLLLLLSFSPLLSSSHFNKNRLLLFYHAISLLLFFSVLSFFCFFVGINYFERNDIEGDIDIAGQYSGLFKHSMILAPCASISAIYSLSNFVINRKKIYKFVWAICTLSCIGCVFLAASRGALIGMFLGITVFLFRYLKRMKLSPLRYLIAILFALIVSFPLWSGITSFVVQKNESNMGQGGVLYSREAKMAARIYEINNNIFTGVGFSVVDEDVDYVNQENGQIEPNSSWLAVWSMTGIFGFLLFLIICIVGYKNASYISDNVESSLFCGIMSFFFIHMFIEGYIFGAGTLQCAFFWLTMGCINARKTTNQLKCKVL